jgi:membrane protein required for colicin V production
VRYGLIRTIFGLGGIVVGVAIAGAYYQKLADKIPIGDDKAAGIIAFVAIFLAVFILAVILGKVLHKLFHWAALGWLDYLGGGILGLLMGGMIAGAALTGVLRFFPAAGATVQSSQLARFLVGSFPLVLNLLPREFQGLIPGD